MQLRFLPITPFICVMLMSIMFLASQAFQTAEAEDTLQIKDLEIGTGDTAGPYTRVFVHYTGTLMDGTEFDSSIPRGQPFSFVLGAGQVIKGWDQGFEGMKVGGKRELIIPPHLGYGARGAGESIPPNATLKFVVEMLGVEGPVLENITNDKLASLQAEGVTVIDIRRNDEWKNTGIIDGALTMTAFNAQMQFMRSFPPEFSQAVKPDQPVVILCHAGNRSSLLANILVTQAGYSKVYNLTDGIAGWIGDGRGTTPYSEE